MATLTGSTIASTYKQLLKVTSEGIGADASAKYIEDGLGTDSALSISTTLVGIGTAAPINGRLLTLKEQASQSAAIDFRDTDNSPMGVIGLNRSAGDIVSGSSANSMIIYNHYSGGVLQLASDGAVRLTLDANSRISLSNNGSGDDNTVFGFLAGASIASGGNDNTLIGDYAGNAITTGDDNVVVGSAAAQLLTTGSHNIVIGKYALDAADASESSNIAIGTHAMGAVDEGAGAGGTFLADSNIAVGFNALYGGAFGSADKSLLGNIAIGDYALDATSTNAQTGTIAIGYQSLTALTSGSGNTAVGYTAMTDVVEGEKNTALGYNAFGGALDTTADASTDNIFIGHSAGSGDWVTAVSNHNIGIGNESMDAVMNGALGNVGVGYDTMGILTGGDYNVSVGHTAGNTITTGVNNTILGAYADVSANGATGQIAIGKGVACTGDNIITVGIAANTASLGLDGSDTSWAAASSDERLKENIELSSAGLGFINDLRPVTYNWKKARDVQQDLPQYKDSDEPVLGKEYGETLHGFIAQEVKSAINKHDEIKEGFKMWQLKDDGTQTVADGNLIPILVKAVQELTARVKELEDA